MYEHVWTCVTMYKIALWIRFLCQKRLEHVWTSEYCWLRCPKSQTSFLDILMFYCFREYWAVYTRPSSGQCRRNCSFSSSSTVCCTCPRNSYWQKSALDSQMLAKTFCLVVSTPPKNIILSIGMIIPKIWGEKVPNHQPAKAFKAINNVLLVKIGLGWWLAYHLSSLPIAFSG